MPHRLANPKTSGRSSSQQNAAASDGALRRVTTGARLHFGLFSTSQVGGRTFGGVGMMVEHPSTCVVARASGSYRATGDEAALVTRLAERVADYFKRPLPAIELAVPDHAPRHAGLGSGTQLAMCIAKLLTQAWGLRCDYSELGLAAGRGKRSGIGVHGFERGGLLADAGKTGDAQLAPLVERIDVPSDWRVLLIWPGETTSRQDVSNTTLAGAVGQRELQAFSQLSATSPQLTAALRHEASEVLLPAMRREEFDEFAKSVTRFNRLAGECFAAAQGGAYAAPEIERLIATLQANGVRGIGQSSWGPVVFAFCECESDATALARQLVHGAAFAGVRPARVLPTRARNLGYAAT